MSVNRQNHKWTEKAYAELEKINKKINKENLKIDKI